MIVYVDTSAALKLLVEEADSRDLQEFLASHEVDLISTPLLETELRRATRRNPQLDQAAASRLLETISLASMPASLFTYAGLLEDEILRSLDALHIAGAIHVGAEAVLTYDRRMADACRNIGLSVVAPGVGA